MKKGNENLKKYLKKYRSISTNSVNKIKNICDISRNDSLKKNRKKDKIVNQGKEDTKNQSSNNNSATTKYHHHRKRSSSYYMGSYIPNSNIFESNYDKDDNNINNNQENNMINFDYSNYKSKNIKSNNKTTSIKKNINNNFDKQSSNNKEKDIVIKKELNYDEKSLISSHDSNNNLNISFPSYEESNFDNSSVIIKQDENSNTNINNSTFSNNNLLDALKIQDNNINLFSNEKSFISFKNTLKYIKDKDERSTPSYQLALQEDKKNNDVNYVATSNVIEEEKSSMLDSEFSNKNEINEKQSILIGNKIKIQNININFEKLKRTANKKINNFINNKNTNNKIKKIENDDNKTNNDFANNKMFVALNQIIIKNNRKEENRRKYLTKNKMNLLNTFFTMNKPLNPLNVIHNNDYYIYDNNKIDQKINNGYLMHHVHTENSNSTKKLDNNNSSKINKNFNKRHTINLNLKPNFIAKEIINIENNNNDLFMTSIPKKNMNKIPHLSNSKQKSFRNTSKELSKNNNYVINTYKKIDPLNSSLKEKNKSSINVNNTNLNARKKNIKSNERRNVHTLKRIENLNNALSFIREKNRLNKTNSTSKNKNNSLSSNSNIKYFKKIKPRSNSKNNTNSSSSINVQINNMNKNQSVINNYNTKSLPRSKGKIKIRINYLRKANSGSFNNKGELISNEVSSDETIFNNVFKGNKNEVIFCLKYKIIFNKLYEKIDVLEKIKTMKDKCFFVILCECIKKYFIFIGLFIYIQEKESFIKLYGDEKSPASILVKDLKNRKGKYNIYEDKEKSNSNTSMVSFHLMEKLNFDNNCIVICKKN